MPISRQDAEEIAKKYLGGSSLLSPLGFGSEGMVFPTMRASAIKVFSMQEKFLNELAVYRRLQARRVQIVLGFEIPALLAESHELMVIEMTLVRPPFLVDFSQATIDKEPDFPEGLDEWWERVAEAFGDRLEIVQNVFWELKRVAGICYYDLAPRNMDFGDRPSK